MSDLELMSSPIETEWELETGAEAFVFNKDDRKRVLNTKVVPFRYICKLEMEFADPKSGNVLGGFLGTGALIAPNKVLTAAHCAFDREFGPYGLARRIRVIPGKTGPTRSKAHEPFGWTTVTRADFPKEWRTAPYYNGAWPHDYAVLTLKSPIGRRAGYLRRIRALSDEFLKRHKVNTSGYPGDKGGNTQWRVYDRNVHILPQQLEFAHDVMGGQSGSPIWVRWQNYRVIVGVVTAHGDKPAIVAANRGVRITPKVLANIQAWVQKK